VIDSIGAAVTNLITRWQLVKIETRYSAGF